VSKLTQDICLPMLSEIQSNDEIDNYFFIDGVKPSVCAYTSLFAATYMATQPTWDPSYGTEYCTNIENSA